MTNEYRFKFEKGSKKHRCPDCQKKTFVRYMDTHTGNYLPDQYGRCDRESNCSYHLNPYRDGYAKASWESEKGEKSETLKTTYFLKPKHKRAIPKAETVFIPFEVFNQTRRGYEQNTFIQNLLYRVPFPFDVKDIERVISLYNLGTVCNGYRAEGITFPFIDKGGNVRAIQVKQFDQTNHTTGTDFIHSIIEKRHIQKNTQLPEWLEAYIKQDKRVSCLFGEHLLGKYNLNPIALVEAPKTAIYGALYFGFPELPENLLWLAVYNLSSLTIDKCIVLQGRDVYLFPDLSRDGKAFQDWSTKANQFSNLLPGTRFIVSDLLETIAPTELREKGADIADILIQLDWRKFRPEIIHRPESQQTYESEKGEKREAPKTTYFLNNEPFPKGEVHKRTGDFSCIISETIVEGITMACFQTNVGGYVDLLFDSEEEPVSPSTEIPKTLLDDFNRNFQPGTLDGKPCLVSIHGTPVSARLEKPEIITISENLTKPNIWEKEISELEAFFNTASIPNQSIKLDKYVMITDAVKFIDNHLNTLKANNGKRTFLPYLNRLQEFKQVLTTNLK